MPSDNVSTSGENHTGHRKTIPPIKLKDNFDVKLHNFKKRKDEFIKVETQKKKDVTTEKRIIKQDKLCNEYMDAFSVKIIRPIDVHRQPESYIYKNGMFERGALSYFHNCCYDMFRELC